MTTIVVDKKYKNSQKTKDRVISIFIGFFAAFTFFATTFFAELFFAAGLLLLFPALPPFLGARVTATIHPLFLGL